jgi:hypothetical protein
MAKRTRYSEYHGQYANYRLELSYAVNVFKQNRIPDFGAAFFEMVAEPAV